MWGGPNITRMIATYDEATNLETISLQWSAVTPINVRSDQLTPQGGPNFPGYGIWGYSVVPVGLKIQVVNVNDGGGLVSPDFPTPDIWATIRFNDINGNVFRNIFGAGIPARAGNPINFRFGTTNIVIRSNEGFVPCYVPYKNQYVGIAIEQFYYDYGVNPPIAQAIDFQIQVYHYPIRKPTDLARK